MCRHVAKENINFSSKRNQHPRLQLVFTNISEMMSRTQRYWVQNKRINKQGDDRGPKQTNRLKIRKSSDSH